ncbi:type I polyketide synthase [Polyangium sp. y55x31]|uniref:type I polyketide synthase n=1 Tax=Polyangium sp. y55x31 TaxID=3042688 RepID=UPI0024828D7D|nr:type I polyketide synthase [Polyangium sp. y55x31]MDI1477095.1 type I polyketide synthase [Polyangium sp. y55x31]
MALSENEILGKLRDAIVALKETRAERDALLREKTEPIAIVGMACRFPGEANSPEEFWDRLAGGADAVTAVPANRWKIDPLIDAEPRLQGARWGAFVGDVDRFDAGFFGISPREAERLDPQQRFLLEVSWEALERAGYDAPKLVGTKTGVFVGIMNTDYLELSLAQPRESQEAYTATGNGHSFPAGRLAYAFGLQGPATAVDTACSSSLVAVHLGCQSLHTRDSDLALVGGVSLMLDPLIAEVTAKTGALAPDGRCKSFDARANGYVRGEGCGVVVLKRLSDAQRDGDCILGLIRGSAVNQDGRSTGLTTPNVLAQQTMLKAALSRAGLSPQDIGYVEAHGTGTPLGDPIEMDALRAVLGQPRADGTHCFVGTVKTNIGHLEAAAGVAGLIKAVLTLQRGVIPRNIHFRALNPRSSLDGTPLVVPTENVPWLRGDRPRRAGVSSFGLSGTNAHVILEEAPPDEARSPEREPSVHLLPLSAKSPEALRAAAHSLAAWLSKTNDVSLREAAYTASVRRTHHEHRLAAVGATREELAGLLASFVRGEAPGGVVQGKIAAQARPKVVFVFPGQGSQWLGMGRALLAQEPGFRASLEACDQAIRAEAGFSVIDEISADEARSRLAEIDVVQPVLFAIEVALASLWRSWGVEPDCVVGHSMGEVAGAHVAGMLSLEDAAKVICRRSRLLRRISGRGAMALVELDMAEAEAAIEGYEHKIGVAVSNGPRSTVLSGDPAALEEVLGALEKKGVFCRRVKVDVASHSPQVDPLHEDFAASLRDIRPEDGRTAMRSTVTGRSSKGAELTASYWWDNLRQPVRFSLVTQALMKEGHTLFVEMSPHPILVPSIEENLRETHVEGAALASMRRQADELRTMLEALGALHVRGCAIQWRKRFPSGGRVVPLPTYPWQRERFWLETRGARARLPREEGAHPLLGMGIVPASQPELHIWEQRLSTEGWPYLEDHRVQGEVVFPGAGYVEMALAAGARVYGEGAVRLDTMSFEQMLVLPRGQARIVQVSLLEEGGGRGAVTISSRAEGAKEWVRHAEGILRVVATSTAPPASEDRRDVEARCPEVLEGPAHYQRMEAQGLSYGKCFQGVERLHLGKGEVVARVRLPDEARADFGDYLVHPALLDACFQAAGWSLRASLGDGTFVPVKVAGVRVHERPGLEVWVHGRLSGDGTESDPAFSLVIRGESGNALVEVSELRVQRLTEAAGATREPFAECVFEVSWRRKDLPPVAETNPGAWLVFADEKGLGAVVAEQLRQRGHTCVEVAAGERYAPEGERRYRVDPTSVEQWQELLHDAFGKDPCRGVIHCAALDGAGWRETSAATVEADLRRGTLSAIRLAQAIWRRASRDAPRLFLLTRGAQAAGVRVTPLAISQAAMWGLGRVLAMELPDLGCVRLDLPTDMSQDEPELVVREVLSGSEEDQVALRPEGRYVARLVRGNLAVEGPAGERREPAAGRPYRLEIGEPGVLERLCLRSMERRPPGPGEVEIEVEAAGLNFLDVMKAMGIYPGMDPRSAQLGGDCAGRIVALGEGVHGLYVGQEVIAAAASSFASHVTTRAEFVARKPAGISFEQAATIPAVFTTVYWALHHVGRLRQGERILIHSATGGTGLAAIQYARSVGAEIFATAGSEEKRAYLRSLGIEHVMDSRTLAFADEVMARTGGRGVDVVLNSLTGDALLKSLDVLGPYGRFLDISKKDIYQNTRLPLLPFRKSLSYTAIDLAGMGEESPERFARLLGEVMAKFEDGTLEPQPVQVFPASSADEAFRWMAQARHIGKIALRMADPAAQIAAPVVRARVRGDGTYLITGGLGGLGLSLAGWLVEQGARHVALMGRSAPSEAANDAIRRMKEAGAEVRVVRGDVSVRADVDAAMAELDRSMPPLRGVVHAAGSLADQTLPEMTEAHFWGPVAPKTLGGWNLHETTRGRDLDFFVAYSSAAGLLGSPGQANYALANTFLDALCQARVADGLPGTSIQWGPFANVGLAAASDVRGKRIASRGAASMTPEEGNTLFGRLLEHPRPEVGLLRFDVRQWLEFYPHMAAMPFLSELLAEKGSVASSVKAGGLRDALDRAGAAERAAMVEAHLREQLGRVLRLEPARIDTRTPFTSFGMDSLMSLELRNRIEASLGLKLSAALLFTYPTAEALAAHLLERLAPAPPASAEGAAEVSPPVAAHAEEELATAGEGVVEGDEAELVNKLEAFEEFLG